MTEQEDQELYGRDHELIVDIKGFYGVPLLLTLVACVSLTIIGYAIQYFLGLEDIGTIVLIASLIYIVSGIKKVQQEEIGLIRLFGEGILRTDAGLVFVPPLIMDLDRETRLDIQDLFPGPDDKIYYGDLEEKDAKLPPGMLKPFRPLFGPPKEGDNIPDKKYAPYHKQMAAACKFGVNWYIYDLLKFRRTIGTVQAAREKIQVNAKGILGAQFAQATPAIILMRLQNESKVLEKALDKMVEAWGIEIISAPIEPFDFSHDLNKSVTKTSETEQAAKQLDISSTAEAAATVRTGAAAASAKKALLQVEIDAEKSRLEARAQGLDSIRKVITKKNGLEVLELDTARSGLENNPNMTIIAGSEGIAHSVAALGKVFRGNEDKGVKPKEKKDEGVVE